MAVAYGSSTIVDWGSVNSVGGTNITLPTGSAEGDLVVLFLDFFGSTSETYSVDSGVISMTEIFAKTSAFSRPNTSYYNFYTWYKFLTSADITTGQVTIASSDTYSSSAKATLVRITGAFNSIQSSQVAASASFTPSYGHNITPSYPNSLLLFRVFSSPYNSNSLTASNYAIATDNPTWTEITDTSEASSSDFAQSSVAYAVRPAITATGNSSVSLSLEKVSNGILLVIAPSISVTVSPSVIDLTANIQAPTVTGGATVSPSVIDLTANIQAPTVTGSTNPWSNQAKSSTTWTNQSKS
jgi:hypothetical protein